MNNILRKLSLFGATCILTGCNFVIEIEEEIELSDLSIMHEEEFGGVYIDISIESFNSWGFKYGDSVDVSFSNGKSLDDIPYYNGYYTKTGEPLLIAYPGYPYIKACINNGDDLYSKFDLGEDDSASIRLNKRGKYKDIQEARDLYYYDDREKYDDDAMFANFREMKTSNLKPGLLYRSASPCDNQHNRAPYVDGLMKENGINYILNLADTKEKIDNYISKEDFSSPYFLDLYNDNKVEPIALNMNFSSDYFKKQLVIGLNSLKQNDGPFLIHCTEGKDRTGFVCLLLETLCGATYEEAKKDYMVTYYNYYRISEDCDKAKYDIIVNDLFDPMLSVITDGKDAKTADLSIYAEEFLVNSGMNQNDVRQLKSKLSA